MRELLMVALLFCMAGPAAAEDPATFNVQAEDLVPTYGGSVLQVNPYPRSAGDHCVILHGGSLLWDLEIPDNGHYVLWFRARAGYETERLFTVQPDNRYRVGLKGRSVRVFARPETLDWLSSETNYLWWYSETLNLDAGRYAITLSSPWEGAHVDELILAAGEQYVPWQHQSDAPKGKKTNPLVVWTGDPYVALDPYAKPPETSLPPPSVRLTIPRGGTSYAAIYLHNSSPERISHVRMHFTAMKTSAGAVLPRSALRLAKLAYTQTMGGVVASDALAEINSLGVLDLAPRSTTMLWLLVDASYQLDPGEYLGRISITDAFTKEISNVDITANVSSVAVPESDDLAVYGWTGLHAIWYEGWHSAEPYWNDCIEHGMDSFRFVTYQNLGYEFDEKGALIGDIDFSRLDVHIGYLRQTGGHILLLWNLADKDARSFRCVARGLPDYGKGVELQFMSEPWKRAFKTLVTKITEYLVAHGIAKDKVLQYTYDEYLGEDFVRVGRLIRQWDGEFKIFSDLSAPLEVYQKTAPFVDLWCPAFSSLEEMARDGRLEFMQSTGKPVWFYDAGHDQRLWSAYGRFRLKFWLAYKHRLDGCTFWKYSGDHVGAVYWPMDVEFGGGPVSGRRWEAWWSGCQDYRILKLAETTFADDPDKLAQITSLVDNVLDNRADTSLAENARIQLIELLERKGIE